jgi:hypothetical protein
MKTSEFIQANGITMTSKRATSNPHMVSDRPMNHWSVTLRMADRRYTLRYSQGLGIQHDPKIEDVLSNIADDANGFDNARDVDDFASEYGYTRPSVAIKVYRAVKHEAKRLRELLGSDELYQQLLWDVERE